MYFIIKEFPLRVIRRNGIWHCDVVLNTDLVVNKQLQNCSKSKDTLIKSPILTFPVVETNLTVIIGTTVPHPTAAITPTKIRRRSKGEAKAN